MAKSREIVPKTVLVVEDDADARTIYSEALSSHGFRVVLGVHGAEGVHLARRFRPDLILMDIRMPVMDGWQAIRYLRSDPAVSRIPIWGISAYLAEEEANAQRWPVSFDRLIPKPIEPRAVVEQVEAEIGLAVSSGQRPPPAH